MIVTTTHDITGKTIIEYKGLVFGEETGLRYSTSFNTQKNMEKFEKMVITAKQKALNKLVSDASNWGANAVVGISFSVDYEGAAILVSATGTAVVVE